MSAAGPAIKVRLKQLETHLEQENPVLLTTVKSFRTLDSVAYQMGLFHPEESFATDIPWWPLVSILGTFSAGKSSFINNYLGTKLQRSGNQAVDDRFTVLCFSKQDSTHALPGQALDSDPRFPFYKISADIEKVAEGEGSRIDAYLQLKTSTSKALNGKILIDSPGFDADAQRTSTLKITDHIINLSDLVLVFFDARHPEPGAMRDTLDHLVSQTIHRSDSGKFLYILNQIDTTAREDNPEEVVAAWQRALGECGLTAGRFFTIYNQEAAMPIADEALRRRFEKKRDADLAEIYERMEQVEVERAYRIVGSLEKAARRIEDTIAPLLTELIATWRKRTLILDAIAAVIIVATFLFVTIKLGHWDGLRISADWWDAIMATPRSSYFAALGTLVAWLLIHLGIRHLTAKSLMAKAKELGEKLPVRGDLVRAFSFSTSPWRSVFSKRPAGWTPNNERRVHKALANADRFVQDLNDGFTNPSGEHQLELAAGQQKESNPTEVAVTSTTPPTRVISGAGD